MLQADSARNRLVGIGIVSVTYLFFTLLCLTFAVWYFYKMRVSNDYYFAMRRVIPVILPGFLAWAAYVIVERLNTTGPESVQEQYGKVSREIVAKFGGRYVARSQHNVLLEGDASTPCCIAILSFPSVEAAKSWYDSPENQDAAKIRRSGATFRIISVEALS